MKKIITMVGTSMFENYFKKENNDVKDFYENLRNCTKRAQDAESEKERIRRLKRVLEGWILNARDKASISAEIKSLVKLKEELNDDFEMYLLCSDTILSELAGEIIRDIFLNLIRISTYVKIKIIEGLQIWDRKEFNKGMSNLITEIYSIAQGYWNNVIINITGGYKATVPYLTILAQINNCPIYYIFEETDALMKIPNIPFSMEWFDWDEIKEYENYFDKLEEGITENCDYYELVNSDFYKKYSFLIWGENTMAELNPIGRIIFKKYKEKLFEFYSTDEVVRNIKNDKNVDEIFKKQFTNKDIRENKTEIKNGHFVYDAGDNDIRIFYLERKDENKIYVYKVFNNHDKYEKYINSTPFDKNILKFEEFKKFKIKKEV